VVLLGLRDKRQTRLTVPVPGSAPAPAARITALGTRPLCGDVEALEGHADALYVCPDPLLTTNRIRINILAVGARLPTMHGFREFVEAGGLMSYGPNFLHLHQRAADYVDKILRGARPADLPVEQPTKFDLVINLPTAKALGLNILEGFLLRADEVIE
jgi:putative tryptophan/tyrosine transport system substrate-binding protein